MNGFVTRRFIVSGRVQGVYFRASTRDHALRLGLRGYAKNLSDGSVEVVANGTADSLEKLAQWLWHGPATAKVTDVQSADLPADGLQPEFATFVTL